MKKLRIKQQQNKRKKRKKKGKGRKVNKPTQHVSTTVVNVLRKGWLKLRGVTLQDIVTFIRVQVAIKSTYYGLIYVTGKVSDAPAVLILCAVLYGLAKVYSIAKTVKKVFKVERFTVFSIIIFAGIFSYTFAVSLKVGHNLFEMIGLSIIYVIAFIFYKKRK